MRRREFIMLLGSATTWSLAARAQQSDKVRRIGVLLPAAADNSEFQTLGGAFLQALAQSATMTSATLRLDRNPDRNPALHVRRPYFSISLATM